jgi:hypothetical protein
LHHLSEANFVPSESETIINPVIRPVGECQATQPSDPMNNAAPPGGRPAQRARGRVVGATAAAARRRMPSHRVRGAAGRRCAVHKEDAKSHGLGGQCFGGTDVAGAEVEVGEAAWADTWAPGATETLLDHAAGAVPPGGCP